MECSTCGREKPVEPYVPMAERIQLLKDVFEEIRESNPDVYQFYREVAEREEIPLVNLLSEALSHAMPEIAAKEHICVECSQPL